MILRVLGRITSGKEGEGTEIFGEENQDLKKNGVGKNIKLLGTLYAPVLIC